MRTTIAVDDTVLDSAKRHALEAHVSLAAYIEGALRDKLAATEVAESASHYRPLRSFKGEGLLPGVDLMDSRALYDRMDELS
jgi:hypothetical protein